MTGHTKLGDVIRALKDQGTTAQPPAQAPQIQVSQEILALAALAASTADASREAGAAAKSAKANLEEAMKEAGVVEVPLHDRKPVHYTESKEKQKTLKALKAVEGVEGWDAKKAKEVWDKLEIKTAHRLQIPALEVGQPDL